MRTDDAAAPIASLALAVTLALGAALALPHVHADHRPATASPQGGAATALR